MSSAVLSQGLTRGTRSRGFLMLTQTVLTVGIQLQPFSQFCIPTHKPPKQSPSVILKRLSVCHQNPAKLFGMDGARRLDGKRAPFLFVRRG
jgi:hypothetical protein